MEFRVFLPVLQKSESSWLGSALVDKYAEVIRLLSTEFTGYAEKRTDTYVVTPAHYGLKYRHGSQLELKVRHQCIDFGIERWTKMGLGKGQEAHVLPLVQRFGYSTHPTEVSFDDRVDVVKSRINVLTPGGLDYEVCELFLPASRSTTGVVHRENWLSLAFEGDHASISGHLLSGGSKRFRECLSTINEILKPVMAEASAQCFVPIVSGYPLFVRCVTGRASPAEYQRDVIGGWDALVQHLSL